MVEAEANKIQVTYKGKVYTVTIENDNSLKLDNIKTIDSNAVGVAHYNTGDTFRRNVHADPKGILRTRDRWCKNVRLIVKDPATNKKAVVDQ
uniref:Uncharacterized protein n=1 Tax=Acrobeloides nanus TaxID=290746 RepID=A0A914EBM8_9BILA